MSLTSAAITILIVSPVFREQDSIGEFHRRLWAVLEDLPEQYEPSVLYVIDPGGDKTEEVVRELVRGSSATSAIVMSNRFGHQMALLAGLDASNSDVVITLDSDLQHPPELIPTLLDRHREGFDVVQTLRTSTHNQHAFKRLLSRWFYKAISILSDTEIAEGGADFRLLSRRVVDVFKTGIRERNQFQRGLIPWIGFPTAYVEFEAADRYAGDSKYSLTRSMRLALDGLVSFSKAPLQLGAVVGGALSVLAFAYALVTLIVWFTAGSAPPGWTSLAVLVAGLSGGLLGFMGILGLYIGAIFDEVKARPHYVVAERMETHEQRD